MGVIPVFACVCVLQLWDLESNKKMADCSGHLSWVQRVQFSPDGSQLLSCSDDQTVRVRRGHATTHATSLIFITFFKKATPEFFFQRGEKPDLNFKFSLKCWTKSSRRIFTCYLSLLVFLVVVGDEEVAHLLSCLPEKRLRRSLQRWWHHRVSCRQLQPTAGEQQGERQRE